MVVLERIVRASAADELPVLLRSLSVPTLTVEPIRKPLASDVLTITRVFPVSATVTAHCPVYPQQPPSTSLFLVAHLMSSIICT